MKITKEERRELHEYLDYLLMTRESLEKLDVKSLQKGMQYELAWSGPRRELFHRSSEFLRDVVGKYLHEAELSTIMDNDFTECQRDARVLADLANALRSFSPLFVAKRDGVPQTEFIDNMIHDFMGIYWGDEPRFFSIEKKRQGVHKRPYRLAYLRLSALDWEKHLKVVGVPAFERQGIISKAYRTSWDAIRKWKSPIEDQFDLVSRPPRYVDLAKSKFAERPAKILSEIKADGDAYWREKMSARSGEDS